VVQDAGAAVMAPRVLASFRVIFSDRERGKALALYGAVAGFASAIRLILGGVLSDANLFGWRWRTVFFLNVPVALVTRPCPPRPQEARRGCPAPRSNSAAQSAWRCPARSSTAG
jgi:MFS family permease